MSDEISAVLRRAVRERAGGRCAYCFMPETEPVYPHEPDHSIALKHGGPTASENLAYARFECNRAKAATLPRLIRLRARSPRFIIPGLNTGAPCPPDTAALFSHQLQVAQSASLRVVGGQGAQSPPNWHSVLTAPVRELSALTSDALG